MLFLYQWHLFFFFFLKLGGYFALVWFHVFVLWEQKKKMWQTVNKLQVVKTVLFWKKDEMKLWRVPFPTPSAFSSLLVWQELCLHKIATVPLNITILAFCHWITQDPGFYSLCLHFLSMITLKQKSDSIAVLPNDKEFFTIHLLPLSPALFSGLVYFKRRTKYWSHRFQQEGSTPSQLVKATEPGLSRQQTETIPAQKQNS